MIDRFDDPAITNLMKWNEEKSGRIQNLESQIAKNRERVATAFDMIAKANTVTILSLDEMEQVVNRALAGEFDQ